MAVRTVRLAEVHTGQLFVAGGSVYRWTDGIGNGMYRNAIRYCPVSPAGRVSARDGGVPGRMRESITKDTSRIGRHQVESTVAVTDPRAKYVLFGTTGPIMRPKARKFLGGNLSTLGPVRGDGSFRKGYMMKLPRWRGYAPYHLFVSGQRANNFLAKAYNATARTHRSLRSLPGPF